MSGGSLLPSIGLARRAGKLVIGAEAVADACRDGSAGLVLLAADLSPTSRKEAVRTAEQHGVRWFDAPFTMQEVEALLHKRAGILAVSDKGFVKMFEKHLPEQKKEDQIV